MSKEDIFEELKAIREYISAVEAGLDMLQELIWKVGEDIGEF